MSKRENYDSYDDHLKVNRAKRHVLEVGVAAIVKALSDSGVSWSSGKEPMSDVCAVHLTFRADGDFRTPEVTITSRDGGCYSVVCLEPTRAEEIADEMVDAVIHDNDLLDLDRVEAGRPVRRGGQPGQGRVRRVVQHDRRRAPVRTRRQRPLQRSQGKTGVGQARRTQGTQELRIERTRQWKRTN